MHIYSLKRSNRRTISLEITRELEVLVRAPLKMPVQAIDSFVNSHEEWISLNIEKQKQRQTAYPEPDIYMAQELKKKAGEYLPEAVRQYARIMGLEPASVKITSAKTRFGSCSPKNGLCFSWRLMQYPKEAVDYVVVHELAHIVHKNHGKQFYECIEEVLPDFKARRAMLKNIKQEEA